MRKLINYTITSLIIPTTIITSVYSNSPKNIQDDMLHIGDSIISTTYNVIEHQIKEAPKRIAGLEKLINN